MSNIELYKKAMGTWGYDSQEDMLIEECSELIQACIKRRRGKGHKNLLEELMDVEIMVEQVKFYYDQLGLLSEMEDIKNRKLSRLAKLLTPT